MEGYHLHTHSYYNRSRSVTCSFGPCKLLLGSCIVQYCWLIIYVFKLQLWSQLIQMRICAHLLGFFLDSVNVISLKRGRGVVSQGYFWLSWWEYTTGLILHYHKLADSFCTCDIYKCSGTLYHPGNRKVLWCHILWVLRCDWLARASALGLDRMMCSKVRMICICAAC